MQASQLIRDVRQRCGHTRAEIAYRMGLDEAELEAIEEGRRRVEPDQLEMLLLVSGAEEPIYRDGVLVGARPILLDRDERRAAERVRNPRRSVATPDWTRRTSALIRDARQRCGHTRAEIAYRMGLDEAELEAIEEGRRRVEPDQLEMLLLVSGAEEPIYRDGVLVGARPIPDEWDWRHIATNLQMDLSQRLAQAFGWNWFAHSIYLDGQRRREREAGA